MTDVETLYSWPLTAEPPNFGVARLYQNHGKRLYLLEFSSKHSFPTARKTVKVSAATVGEATGLGRRIADDSRDKWLFEKASLVT